MLKKLNSFFAIDRQKENNKGFTIVEVMIVLAVAGLILAVVFVAVPALQRNQRNTARKNDVAYIKTQLNTLTANNGNRLPTTAGQISNVLKHAELNYLGSTANTGNVTVGTNANSADNTISFPAITTTHTFDKDHNGGVILLTGKSCVLDIMGSPGSGNGVITSANTGDASRNIAIIYTLEGDDNVYCEDTTL